MVGASPLYDSTRIVIVARQGHQSTSRRQGRLRDEGSGGSQQAVPERYRTKKSHIATNDAPPIPSIDFLTSSMVAILDPRESRMSFPSNSATLLPRLSRKYLPSISPTLLPRSSRMYFPSSTASLLPRRSRSSLPSNL